MSDLILHHYPASPFAEKIRLMMGRKGLVWRSVTIPMIMPKPDLVALTGGYRRTPVLQIGADVYCDTALMADVLEQRAPEPPAFPPSQKGLARVLAQWADTTLFQTAMAYNFQPAGASAFFPDPEQLKIFAADRAAMRNNAPRMPVPDATAAYKSYLRRIASMLEHQSFLLGEHPCIADFSVYHPLWFTRHQVPVLAGILDAVPAVLAWMDNMAAIGHGSSSAMTADESLGIAQAATPEALPQEIHQDDHGIALGQAVVIVAEAFGLEPTEGTLVAASRTRYTLRREDPRVGWVHVHFPRVGYLLKAT
ncbi:MAG: glutathione S-transferase family protein [Oxalobacteraceae bacterium]